jgi:hypothetical protein
MAGVRPVRKALSLHTHAISVRLQPVVPMAVTAGLSCYMSVTTQPLNCLNDRDGRTAHGGRLLMETGAEVCAITDEATAASKASVNCILAYEEFELTLHK